MAKQEYTNKMICDALINHGGDMSKAALELGCGRVVVSNRCKKCPELMQAVQDAKESLVDLAEAELRKAVREGKAWAITLVTTRLGKERGYSDKDKGEDGGSSGKVEITIKRE